MSRGSHQSFDIHRHNRQATIAGSGQRLGGLRSICSLMWKISSPLEIEWQQQPNATTSLECPVLPGKQISRSHGNVHRLKSRISVNIIRHLPHLEIFNLPGELLSYHTYQPRVLTNRSWQCDDLLLSLPSNKYLLECGALGPKNIGRSLANGDFGPSHECYSNDSRKETTSENSTTRCQQSTILPPIRP